MDRTAVSKILHAENDSDFVLVKDNGAESAEMHRRNGNQMQPAATAGMPGIQTTLRREVRFTQNLTVYGATRSTMFCSCCSSEKRADSAPSSTPVRVSTHARVCRHRKRRWPLCCSPSVRYIHLITQNPRYMPTTLRSVDHGVNKADLQHTQWFVVCTPLFGIYVP